MQDLVICLAFLLANSSLEVSAAVESYQIVSPEVAKKFQKKPKSEFWQMNSPHFRNLAKNSPKLLQIGGKVAILVATFGENSPLLVTLLLCLGGRGLKQTFTA